MAKKLFRFLRGELNGFYLNSIHGTLNVTSEKICNFFAEFKSQEFKAGKIKDDYLFGLGTFAGIFLPRVSRAESVTSLYMTDSHESEGNEYSERGLFNTEREVFEFFNLSEEEGLPDTNNFSTSTLRSSLVGDEVAIGYISSESRNVIDDDGNIRREYVLSTPPVGVAYSEYYGDNFMFLSEAEKSYENLESSLYIELFEALQWVSYNGMSTSSLCKIVALVCPEGLIKLTEVQVASDGKHFNVYYIYNEDADIQLKQQRIQLLEYIIGIKFPQVVLVEQE